MITKLDIHNINGRELFADPSFCLVAQTTQDGAALAREKEAQRIAKEAAEQAQGRLFDDPLAKSFARTVEGFQATIMRIAMAADMPRLAVYALWRKYSTDCSNSDQSAVLGEFVEWYAKDLGGDKELLRKAIG